jgi:hypothetical protein
VSKVNKSEYISARVEPDIAASLKAIAKERGVKHGTIAREILTDYARKAKSSGN